ncbi:DUF3613 domain-containing protein [Paraburkholderia solisilvae]|uniref:DUF3613 domain-containing protein n=1 Tax=Paraburkholderia solisilvae TaxID=624376 RepID=A0A6J5DYN5_9BURK|nr:DUF3613 domain-containing protein [Paraburkholderia solisilvae]CAB3758351.1 hypothetical protein LMG29739_02916 [Paraburkholderia solisilvae]
MEYVKRGSPLILATCVEGVLAVALAFGVAQAAVAQTQTGAAADPHAVDAVSQPAADASDAPPASEIGHATLSWLDLQRSGRAAAAPQPMLGAEASLAYQRYLDSFRTKIPASFGSSIDSGYSGNQLHVDYTNGGGPQN